MSEDGNETPNRVEAQSESADVGAGNSVEAASAETSEKKKQANRENARHSTGPKSNWGKNCSRLNALRHGLYTKDVVIQQGDLRENREEFDLLLEGLRRSWNPTDLMQEILVQTIAEVTWRKRRLMRAEVGEIRRPADSYRARQSLDLFDEHGVLDPNYWSAEEQAAGGTEVRGTFWSRAAIQNTVRNKTLLIGRKLLVLRQVRNVIHERGGLNDDLQRALDAVYGRDHALAKHCYELSQLAFRQQMDDAHNAGSDADIADPMALQRKLVMGYIDLEIQHLEESLRMLEQAEALEHKATLLAHNMPSKEFVDKLVRLETTFDRSLQRAIKTLLILKGKKS